MHEIEGMREIVCPCKCWHSCVSTAQYVSMKGRDPEWEKEITRKNGRDFEGYAGVNKLNQ